ncbi:TPA: hypothetical protein HA251_02995 [Candidatus Woesearchaeota archaeon]|nr:hypothetical protein [Candidatus Woesearchaeota archaeon]
MASNDSKGRFALAVLLVMLCYLSLSAFFGYSFTQGANNRNVSVDTTVNITNALPEVLYVSISPVDAPNNITLNAGSTRLVYCNATLRDWNGGGTVVANATFFHNASVNSTAADDNNTHYANSTCANISAPYGTNGELINVSCSFPVLYYANVGFWRCNVTVTDNYNYNESVVNSSRSNFNSTHINAIYALNVTPLIDYGNLSVGDTSDPQEANVTNLGNTNINISVRGFTNTSYLSNGLGMVCDVGNISIASQKYNAIGGTNPATYTNLSHTSAQVSGLTIAQQTNDSQQVVNATYWLLYVPPNPFGRCNGTIVFQAERS